MQTSFSESGRRLCSRQDSQGLANHLAYTCLKGFFGGEKSFVFGREKLTRHSDDSVIILPKSCS